MVEDPQDSPQCGYRCFMKSIAAIVIKEHGSNGRPWIRDQSLNDDRDCCDGLSFSVGTAAQDFHETYKITPLQESTLCHGTIARGCLQPGLISGMPPVPGIIRQPVRPTKILFSKEGIMNLLREPLLDMGINQVGIASRKLIQSLRSTFSDKTGIENPRNAALMAAMADPSNPETLANLLEGGG